MSDYAFTYDEEILTLLRDIRDPLADMRDDMVDVVTTLWSLRDALQVLSTETIAHFEKSADLLDQIADNIVDSLVETTTFETGAEGEDVAGGVLKSIFGIIKPLKPLMLLLDAFSPLIEMLIDPFTMLVDQFAAQFYPIIVALLPFLWDLVFAIMKLMLHMVPIITKIAEWISENVTLENVITALIEVWKWLKVVLDPLVNLVLSLYYAFKDLKEALDAGDMSAMKDFVVAILNAIVKYVGEVIESYKEAIQGWGKKVLDWFGESLEKAQNEGSYDPELRANTPVWYNPTTWI